MTGSGDTGQNRVRNSPGPGQTYLKGPLSTQKDVQWAAKMAQRVRVSSAKPVNLSSVPGTQKVEGKN